MKKSCKTRTLTFKIQECAKAKFKEMLPIDLAREWNYSICQDNELIPGEGREMTMKIDGVVKTLHLRRCCKISIITTYSSTPK